MGNKLYSDEMQTAKYIDFIVKEMGITGIYNYWLNNLVNN